MFHWGGKDDLGIRVPEPLESAYEGIQLHGGVKCHLNEHGVFSCDAVTLKYIGAGLDKWIELPFLFGCHFQIDIGFDVVAQFIRIHGT